MAAPMDLNVPLCETTVLINKIKTAFQLGYEVVAINNDIPDLLSDCQEKSKKKKIHIKPGVAIKLSEEDLLKATGPRRKPFRQLSRISMVLKDNIQSHLINTPQIQNYDLIAITPTSEKTLQIFGHIADIQLPVNIGGGSPLVLEEPPAHYMSAGKLPT